MDRNENIGKVAVHSDKSAGLFGSVFDTIMVLIGNDDMSVMKMKM